MANRRSEGAAAPVPARPPGRIVAVLFDFTGVVTTSAFPTIGSLGDEAGVEPEVVLELMLGDYTADTDHPWHRLERGEIAVLDYAAEIESMAAEGGIDLDLARLADLMGELEVHQVTVDTIRGVRRVGYRTALVTNNVREAGEQWRRMVPLGELFDVVVDSSEVGRRKPDPAIYHLTLERLGGVEPGRAVHLDDHPGNVAGAHRAGLHALLVDDADPAAAMRALVEFLDELR